MRAHWRAEDFPPLFFGEKCEPIGEQRIFLLCFSEKNASPLASRGFSSFVFRRKMRAHWRAEDFPPLFFGEKCEPIGEQRIFLLCFSEKNASPLASRGFSSFACLLFYPIRNAPSMESALWNQNWVVAVFS